MGSYGSVKVIMKKDTPKPILDLLDILSEITDYPNEFTIANWHNQSGLLDAIENSVGNNEVQPSLYDCSIENVSAIISTLSVYGAATNNETIRIQYAAPLNVVIWVMCNYADCVEHVYFDRG